MTTTQNADAPEGPDAARIATLAAAAFGAVLATGALALFGTRAALSVAVGATIAVANLVTLRAIIRAVLARADDGDANTGENHHADGKRGGAAWGAFAVVKIVVLFGGIWILLTRGWVDPIPLVVGYGVLPLGIAASSIASSLVPRRRPRASDRQ